MITYLFFRLLVFKLRFVPFTLLYVLSDFFSFVIFKIFKYRVKVINANLRRAFPEKPDSEIQQIERKFYKHFTDITLESLKGFSCSPQKLKKRYLFLNTVSTDTYFEQGKNIIIAAGHYGNWEWGPLALTGQMKHLPIGLYKPLKNKYIDSYIRRNRAKWGAMVAPIENTRFVFTNKPEKPLAVAFIADQSPSNTRKAIWIKFLNQDTACLHGLEFYSKMYNTPVIYFAINRVKRGYYEVSGTEIAQYPNDCADNAITQKYMQLLEEQIMANPQFWLWSHKRWKHKRTADNEIIRENI